MGYMRLSLSKDKTITNQPYLKVGIYLELVCELSIGQEECVSVPEGMAMACCTGLPLLT